MGKVKYDLTGKRFGNFTVLERNTDTPRRSMWKCKCDCGTITFVESYTLRKGLSKSCGCQQPKRLRELRTTHGKTNTRVYKEYNDIKKRCYNPNCKNYKYYGNKGIKMCEEWLEDFMAFYNWCVNNGYRDDLTIDRIDNTKGYSPDNCRWVSIKEQENNRTNNIRFSYNGENHTIAQWVEITGIKYTTLYQRYKKGYRGSDLFVKSLKENKHETLSC